MPKITIKTDSERQVMLERIEDLAGCLEGTAEERELIALLLAIAIWEVCQPSSS